MRKLMLQTNYNHKLPCNGFVHIDHAPAYGIPESDLGKSYLIETRDESSPAVTVVLDSLIRFTLKETYDIYTIPSHGLLAKAFIEAWLKMHPEDTLETWLAAYFYFRV